MGASSDEPAEDEWAEPPPSLHAPATRPAEETSDHVRVGTVFGGRYEVKGVLGEGGFGVVYDAEHVELGSPVALKVLKSELTDDETLFRRFQQEARTAAAIGHSNIIQVFDLGKDEHGAYIAMEKLEGEELKDRAEREHPLSEAFVTRVGAEVADAIAAAHEAGVIHRDLKPQNIFLVPQSRREDAVKVIDFGIAKLVRRVGDDLTKTGQLFGTPRYMAPEQLRGGKHVDGRVDVYAIGALLYRVITNAYPFDGETYPELLLKIMADDPPAMSELRPDLSPRFIEIIDKAMRKNPDDRFATARELADALFDHLPDASAEVPDDLPSGPRVRAAEPHLHTPQSFDRTRPAGSASGSTADRGGGPANRAGYLGAGVLALATLLGLGAWAMSGEPAQEPETRTEVDATADEPSEVEPAEPIEVPTLDLEAPTEPEPPPPPMDPIPVHMVSTPPGAQIRVAGAVVCMAPCDVELRQLPVVITAELDGYVTAERSVSNPATTEVSLVLARRPEAPRPVRPPRPSPREDPLPPLVEP